MKKYYLIISALLQSAFFMADAPSITIYIHGSQVATKLLPKKDLWFCKQGLHHISNLPNSSMYVRDAHLLHKGDSAIFDKRHYYTFGWPGKVDFACRKKAGSELYVALKQLLEHYHAQYNQYPAVTIITHSHGGNVALHMVENLPFFAQESVALRLILCACPVQKATEHLITNPYVSWIYNLYSTADFIQTLDFYSDNGDWRFPKRIFHVNISNCTQILVKINDKALGHVDLWHTIIKHIPAIMHFAQEKSGHIHYNTIDPDFCFFNGLNLEDALSAKGHHS